MARAAATCHLPQTSRGLAPSGKGTAHTVRGRGGICRPDQRWTDVAARRCWLQLADSNPNPDDLGGDSRRRKRISFPGALPRAVPRPAFDPVHSIRHVSVLAAEQLSMEPLLPLRTRQPPRLHRNGGRSGWPGPVPSVAAPTRRAQLAVRPLALDAALWTVALPHLRLPQGHVRRPGQRPPHRRGADVRVAGADLSLVAMVAGVSAPLVRLFTGRPLPSFPRMVAHATHARHKC